VRKTSVIPAAVLAAGFLFCLSPVVEGTTARHSKSAHAGSKAAGSGRTELHKNKKRTPVAKAKKQVPKSHKKVRHVIRQDSQGAVVAERVARAVPEPHGPFLPVEEYNFPQIPCAGWDAIIEAHEHEADEEDPEPADVADAVPTPAVNPITLVARTIGSFLRPKSAQSTLRPEDVDLSDLLLAGVRIPVEGVDSSRLKDSFLNSRGKHRQHLAIDIGAPNGTPVLAAADGEVVQLRREKRGGISLYQKDATGRYLLFYCHLTKYAQGLRPGQTVVKGDVIAYVGRTGHVIGGPHLHFSITRLPEDDDNFKAGIAINPYLLFLAAVP
jgi:murein DD-endopeptidase MepM/ murein hydrolase activator NlpD